MLLWFNFINLIKLRYTVILLDPRKGYDFCILKKCGTRSLIELNSDVRETDRAPAMYQCVPAVPWLCKSWSGCGSEASSLKLSQLGVLDLGRIARLAATDPGDSDVLMSMWRKKWGAERSWAVLWNLLPPELLNASMTLPVFRGDGRLLSRVHSGWQGGVVWKDALPQLFRMSCLTKNKKLIRSLCFNKVYRKNVGCKL